jgi:hypothetical protein
LAWSRPRAVSSRLLSLPSTPAGFCSHFHFGPFQTRRDGCNCRLWLVIRRSKLGAEQQLLHGSRDRGGLQLHGFDVLDRAHGRSHLSPVMPFSPHARTHARTGTRLLRPPPRAEDARLASPRLASPRRRVLSTDHATTGKRTRLLPFPIACLGDCSRPCS